MLIYHLMIDTSDLFKNNQLLHALSPLVFSYYLGAQYQAYQKVAS